MKSDWHTRTRTAILARFIGNPHLGKSYAVNLNHAHEEPQDLVERVTIELELINFAKELDS
ncbi:hypothetical protein [Yoonia sp. 2307UL14-13]|uniref:hypothetical protein n=1 Tax=Yoonia sp. 2307UL14-13 TaxID=3126506 RepID=UPI0030A9D496